MLAAFDTEFAAQASLLRKQVQDVVAPILKQLEASGKLKDKAEKSVGHILDDVEGTLRAVWKAE